MTHPLRSLIPLAVVLATSSASTAHAQSLAACVASTTPLLTAYAELSTPGARVRVRLRYDDSLHAWSPAPRLEMLLHHASSIDYGTFALPARSGDTLELEIVAVERVLQRFDASTHELFFVYRVRVEHACVLR